METIQIHVSVELNLSQDVKNFIASTVANFLTGTSAAPKSVAPTPTAPASVAPAPTAPASAAPKSVAPAPTAPTAPVTSATPTIEQVRQALAAKVNGHREEIKAKLNSFGAPSVTKLDPAKYSEMFEFLLNLS